jgi:hypothetical protein
MSLKRNLWLIPVAAVSAAVALYLALVSSRSTIDQSELVTTWAMYAAIFVAFAAIALFAYRSLRDSRSATDEARSRPR